jgi:NADPH2:quinone reductase
MFFVDINPRRASGPTALVLEPPAGTLYCCILSQQAVQNFAWLRIQRVAMAIQIDRFGDPEVMVFREVQCGDPGPGMVRLKHTAIGLNFIDTYHRSGLYPLELPSGLGLEAAGIVEALGAGVRNVAVGDRVAYTSPPPGAYAEQRCYPADQLVRIPESVDDRIAAAAMLKGLTAWYLVKRSHAVRPGDAVLLYAAAGGVGLIAAQWAASLGATVLGVVSTKEKARLARENGCAHVIRADEPDFVPRVRDLTGGSGVAAVYDSVGRDTFFQSLDCLRPHGTMVTYGNASGPVEAFSPMELAQRGSLFLTRPRIFDFIATREGLELGAAELFAVIESRTVRIRVNQTYALKDAAQAHRDLEARQTTGSTILLP